MLDHRPAEARYDPAQHPGSAIPGRNPLEYSARGRPGHDQGAGGDRAVCREGEARRALPPGPARLALVPGPAEDLVQVPDPVGDRGALAFDAVDTQLQGETGHEGGQVPRHHEQVPHRQIAGRALAIGEAATGLGILQVHPPHQHGPVGHVVAEDQPALRGGLRTERRQGHETELHLEIEETGSGGNPSPRASGLNALGKQEGRPGDGGLLRMLPVVGAHGDVLVRQANGQVEVGGGDLDHRRAGAHRDGDGLQPQTVDEVDGVFAGGGQAGEVHAGQPSLPVGGDG